MVCCCLVLVLMWCLLVFSGRGGGQWGRLHCIISAQLSGIVVRRTSGFWGNPHCGFGAQSLNIHLKHKITGDAFSLGDEGEASMESTKVCPGLSTTCPIASQRMYCTHTVFLLCITGPSGHSDRCVFVGVCRTSILLHQNFQQKCLWVPSMGVFEMRNAKKYVFLMWRAECA